MKNLKPILAALFGVVAVCHLWFAWSYASPLPYNDEWDGPVSRLLIPHVTGTLTWGALIAPFNEHRMLWTNLWDLLLFHVFGRYDNLLECEANAFLYAAILTLFAWMLIKRTGQVWPVAASCAAIGIIPLGWENTIGGFQSQQYFMVLFSLLALYFLSNPGRDWWWGFLFSVCAVFTLSSGFVAAMVGFLLTRGKRRELVIFSVFALGAFMRFSFDPGITGWPDRNQDSNHAHSLWDFTIALGRDLSTPCQMHPWAFVIVLAPVVLVFREIVKAGHLPDRFCLGLFLWWLAQCAGLAWQRANIIPDHMILPRYWDVLALLIPLACACLFILCRPVLRGVWITTVAFGACALMQWNWQVFQQRLNLNRIWDMNTRHLLQTGDFQPFEKAEHFLLPSVDCVTPEQFYTTLTNAVQLGIIKPNLCLP